MVSFTDEYVLKALVFFQHIVIYESRMRVQGPGAILFGVSFTVSPFKNGGFGSFRPKRVNSGSVTFSEVVAGCWLWCIICFFPSK